MPNTTVTTATSVTTAADRAEIDIFNEIATTSLSQNAYRWKTRKITSPTAIVMVLERDSVVGDRYVSYSADAAQLHRVFKCNLTRETMGDRKISKVSIRKEKIEAYHKLLNASGITLRLLA